MFLDGAVQPEFEEGVREQTRKEDASIDWINVNDVFEEKICFIY